MTAQIARLRPAPAIEFEPEGGLRLRRTTAEAGLDNARGADSRPRQWTREARDVQMRAKVAATLADEVFRNLRALGDLCETTLIDDVGLEELSYQIHEIQKAADLLQSARKFPPA